MTKKNESWLIFFDSPMKVLKYLKPGFQHIMVLQKDNFNWYIIDPSKEKMNVTILNYPASEDVVKTVFGHRPSLRVEVDPKIKHMWFGRPLFGITCVTMAKYILGIKLFCLTPYGLYKKLKDRRT